MWRVNPLRCARGAVPQFTSINFGAVGLFNNSTGAHLINVMMVANDPGANAAMQFYVTKNRLSTQNVGTIVPVVTDEAVPVGQLDTDDLAALPLADFFPSSSFFMTVNQGNPYPIAVLRPGWSFVAVSEVKANTQANAFFWEWMYAEELFRLSAGDSADGE